MLALVYASLTVILCLGLVAGPHYVNSEENNYFLTGSREVVSGPREIKIALECEKFMSGLESDFNRDIKALGSSAYKEYKENKGSRQDVSPCSLAGKYMKKIRKLEDSYDSRFTAYVKNMEKKLKTSSLSIELAEQARYAYRVEKRKIKNNFYDKAKEMIGKQ
ncbi:MAG: hypothetical protein K9L56_11415 [Clostridiales bacterium]|nr:hypothetical protein [Clostridiales bacterium]